VCVNPSLRLAAKGHDLLNYMFAGSPKLSRFRLAASLSQLMRQLVKWLISTPDDSWIRFHPILAGYRNTPTMG
jgi:hypothetical protein